MPADQGSDFTDASMTGFVSSVTYKEQGTPVTTTTRTTQRGLAVVQTEVTVSGQASTQKKRGRAAALNTRWHRQVLLRVRGVRQRQQPLSRSGGAVWQTGAVHRTAIIIN